MSYWVRTSIFRSFFLVLSLVSNFFKNTPINLGVSTSKTNTNYDSKSCQNTNTDFVQSCLKLITQSLFDKWEFYYLFKYWQPECYPILALVYIYNIPWNINQCTPKPTLSFSTFFGKVKTNATKKLFTATRANRVQQRLGLKQRMSLRPSATTTWSQTKNVLELSLLHTFPTVQVFISFPTQYAIIHHRPRTVSQGIKYQNYTMLRRIMIQISYQPSSKGLWKPGILVILKDPSLFPWSPCWQLNITL